jgi:hypothetical protein
MSQQPKPNTTECPMCGGSGGWPGIEGWVACKPCNGSGRILPHPPLQTETWERSVVGVGAGVGLIAVLVFSADIIAFAGTGGWLVELVAKIIVYWTLPVTFGALVLRGLFVNDPAPQGRSKNDAKEF